MPVAARIPPLLLLLVVVAGASCAPECESNLDCQPGFSCVDALCLESPQDGFTIVSPAEGADVGATFDLELRVEFEGAFATLSVDTTGDPCVPFVPVRQTLFGVDGERFAQDVVLPGLPARGPDFDVRVTLTTNKEILEVVTLRGPAAGAGVGGFSFRSPFAPDADAVKDAWLPVKGEMQGGRVSTWLEPIGAPPTPRRVVAEGALELDSALPLVRGPQIVWVETQQNDVTQLCGHGLIGGPDGDDQGSLEFALLTESEDAAWLDLSVHFDDGGVCDVSRFDDRCRGEAFVAAPAPLNRQVVRVKVQDGVVEVAAVPLVISGPVTAWLRVSRAGRHEGFFGPFPLLPSDGQAWFAGRVVVQAGQVQALSAVDETTLGAPW